MTNSLVDQIKVLVELQKIDARVFALKQELAAFPAAKSGHEAKRQALKATLEAQDKELKNMILKQKELEGKVLEKEEAVRKFQAQQVKVKTNQEYSALTHEIENAKADKSLAEDGVLTLMDEVEAQKKKVAEEKIEVEKKSSVVQQELAELEKRQQSLSAEIGQLSEERKKFTTQVEHELLSQYERILQKRGGAALAKLRGGSCSGCSLNFPPQVVNMVKIKEEIVTCESCSRIVYEE